MLWVRYCFSPLHTECRPIESPMDGEILVTGDATSRLGDSGLNDGILNGLQFGMLDAGRGFLIVRLIFFAFFLGKRHNG